MFCMLIKASDSPCHVLLQLAAPCLLLAHLPQTSSYASTPAAQTSTGGPYGLTPLLDSMDSSTDLLSWKGTDGFFSTCTRKCTGNAHGST
jgi:hypothetical protein